VDTNWPYVGLFQIDVELHADLILSMGYAIADMYEAGPNVAVAWRLSYAGVNTVPWPVTQWWC
jgi:hypothetical protein